MQPPCANLLHRHAHAYGIDFRRRGQGADRYGHRVCLTTGTGNAGEQKCRTLRLPQSTLILPANQRVQLGVLVDGPINPTQQAARVEASQVVLKGPDNRRCPDSSNNTHGRAIILKCPVDHYQSRNFAKTRAYTSLQSDSEL